MTRRRLSAAVGAWLSLSVLLWASDASPSVVVLGGVVAVLAASVLVALDLLKGAVRVKWPQRRVANTSSGEGDRRVAAMRRQAAGAVRQDSPQLHETLVGLVDDRLRTQHLIDRGAAPEEALSLLTPTLRHLIADQRRRAPTVRMLRQIVSDIEAL